MTRILADLRHWMRDRRSTPWTRFSAPTGSGPASRTRSRPSSSRSWPPPVPAGNRPSRNTEAGSTASSSRQQCATTPRRSGKNSNASRSSSANPSGTTDLAATSDRETDSRPVPCGVLHHLLGNVEAVMRSDRWPRTPTSWWRSRSISLGGGVATEAEPLVRLRASRAFSPWCVPATCDQRFAA